MLFKNLKAKCTNYVKQTFICDFKLQCALQIFAEHILYILPI